MKVSELIEVLQGCDPGGSVSFSLPCDVVEGTRYGDGFSYAYVPLVQALFSTKAVETGSRADFVNFEIPTPPYRDKYQVQCRPVGAIEDSSWSDVVDIELLSFDTSQSLVSRLNKHVDGSVYRAVLVKLPS